MKTSFENTAGLGHSSCLSMWSRVRRGEVSPAGGPGAAPGDPNCTGGGWGVPWKSWASAPNPAIGTSFGNCDMESHVVAAGDALNAAQHRCLERWAEFHVGISGQSAQAVRGEPTVLVVSRARSTVGKGRQSRDAGEPVILAKRAPFHWGAWKTVWSLCLGVRGSPEQGIKSPAPIYPVWKLLPLPTASACPTGGHTCLRPGKRRPAQGPMVGGLGSRSSPSAVLSPGGAGWLHWPGLVPWLQPLRGESGEDGGFLGGSWGGPPAHTSHSPIAAGSQAGVPTLYM